MTMKAHEELLSIDSIKNKFKIDALVVDKNASPGTVDQLGFSNQDQDSDTFL